MNSSPSDSVVHRALAFHGLKLAWTDLERAWENPHTATLNDRLPDAAKALDDALADFLGWHVRVLDEEAA